MPRTQAKALLVTKPEHFVERAKASRVVREIEAKEQRKAKRKSKHLSNSEVRM
jgi:hypothetical protein